MGWRHNAGRMVGSSDYGDRGRPNLLLKTARERGRVDKHARTDVEEVRRSKSTGT